MDPSEFEKLGLTGIIRLQNQLSQALKRRFEKPLALAFTDIVGSTQYFSRFGDEAGRALQQLHYDLLHAALPAFGGRVVDTAGDGAFMCFPTVEGALDALSDLLGRASEANVNRGREHRIALRVGAHYGPVLTDGTVVTGDSVNLASRIASTCEPGELRLSTEALREMPSRQRVRCRSLAAQRVKGVAEPLALFAFGWRDPVRLPTSVFVKETGQELAVPALDTVAFGRLAVSPDNTPANDVVLALTDKRLEQAVSRWHFELRRKADGFVLRAVSAQPTEVDGKAVEKGTDVPLRVGSIVRLSNAVTLEFRAAAAAAEPRTDTTMAPMISPLLAR